MQNIKTKNALISSIMSIALCGTMLIGGTYAWFTDQASTKTNSIVAGTLDIALEQYDAENDQWIPVAEVLDFIDMDDNDLWEPGCTYSLPKLRIANDSNLALDYEVVVNGVDSQEGLNAALEWTITGDGVGSLLPADKVSDEIVISAHMSEDAGNDFQGLTMDGVSITVYATQKASESDSTGSDYDKDAAFGPATFAGGTHAVDLATKDIAGTEDVGDVVGISSGDTYVGLAAMAGSDVVIDGDGKVSAHGKNSDDDYIMAVYVKDGSTVTIKDGDFTISCDEGEGECDLVYIKEGTVVIEGGKFKNEISPRMTLNCLDANYKNGTATFVVKGGMFFGFDPANAKSENPAANFVADGFVSVQCDEDGTPNANGEWFKVVAE